MTGELRHELDTVSIYPAKHFITDEDKLKQAITDIERELQERIAYYKSREMLLEAQRIEQRTLYDLEMLREIGYCAGIENYSRHLDQRAQGSAPWTLVDYMPSDYLLILDEVAHDRTADPWHVQRRPVSAKIRWCNTAFACPRRWTTAR